MRLLNFSDTVFTQEGDGPATISEAAAQEIRSLAIFNIVESLGADEEEHRLGALYCLNELPDSPQIL